MAKYSVFGAAGTANTTAATAGLMKVDNAATTLAAPRIYEWSVSPAANAVDNNYGVQLKRQTTAGTWTAVTPSPTDPALAAAVSTAGRASTAAGSAGVVLGTWGFNQRAGYRWVAVPGGEFVVNRANSNGIILEYYFAQGTDVNNATIFFDE